MPMWRRCYPFLSGTLKSKQHDLTEAIFEPVMTAILKNCAMETMAWLIKHPILMRIGVVW